MVTVDSIDAIVSNVHDPEVPVLTIKDLGILRSISQKDDIWVVEITPTYSGCPAMKTIESEIKEALLSKGISNVEIVSSLSPAWTTDWLSEEGKRKLEAYGIAPPVDEVDKNVLFSKDPIVPCPRCKSKHTKMISQFSSTACKAHFQCQDCLEPFDYFKCLR